MSAELARAFVQIVPTAKGLKGSLTKLFSGEAGEAGEKTGQSMGMSMLGKLKILIAAAGIGKAIAASISEGAELQQSIGGIETLFKDSSDTVIKYAEEAYKTAGLSANEYMQSVTGFSASLLQGLGGDTAKAAEVANMAMIDMSDNANKMGTDMSSIMNAYQGFAKQNYTMLDNLKLGYGGTKSEMERLLADAQKLTGVKYDINNLSDVYEAIHAIQENLDITGTTALEAASTISGSAASMKSAFKNVLGNLALGRAITPSLVELVETTSTFLFGNLLPAVGNIISAVPEMLTTLVTTSVPILMEQGKGLIETLSKGFMENAPVFYDNFTKIMDETKGFVKNKLPGMLESGVEIISNLANGMMSNLPEAVSVAGQIMDDVLDVVLGTEGQLLEAGGQLIVNVGTGFLEAAPGVIDSLSEIVSSLIARFMESYPEFMDQGIALIGQLASGILENAPEVIVAIGGMLMDAGDTIISHLPEYMAKGAEIIFNIVSGIVSAIPDVLLAIGDLVVQSLLEMGSHVAEWIEKGAELTSKVSEGIKNKVGEATGAIGTVLNEVATAIKNRDPEFLNSGINAIKQIADGFLQNIEEAKQAIGNVMEGSIQKIKDHYSEYFEKGSEIIKQISSGISSMISDILGVIGEIIDSIKGAFDIDWGSVGRSIVDGIKNGISQTASSIAEAAKSAAKQALDAAKSFLGIHSPSRVFRDQVGEMISEGWAEGIDKGAYGVEKAMKNLADLSTEMIDVDLSADITGTNNINEQLLGVLFQILEYMGVMVENDTAEQKRTNPRELIRVLQDLGVVFA